MARFWVGTSGWQYRDWRGRFYPKALPQKDWLAYYCEHFSTVEINNSFYVEPSAKSWERWRETAPEGFRYAVKAHGYLTHRKRLKDCDDSLERVLRGATGLKSHLGLLLFQLPPHFKRTEEHAVRLEHFLAMLPLGLRCTFEFRDRSWFSEDTMEQLRRYGVAFCSYDKPDVKCPLAATARFAYMRFHGPSARYRGKYTDEMLEDWAERLRKLAENVDEVYCYFNNDAQAHAVTNAKTLARLVDAAPTAVLATGPGRT
jgi:uncharacterized protein YecE (DUF72 family)